MPECGKCGYNGSRREFKYVCQAEEIGAATLRRCPQCGEMVYCDEMVEDEKMENVKVWGLGKMRGQTFKAKKRKERKVE